MSSRGFVRADSGDVTYAGPRCGAPPHELTKLGIARTLQGVGLFAGLTVLENVMAGAQAAMHADIGSAFLGIWRSSREERRVAERAAAIARRARRRRLRRPAPGGAALRHPEAGRAGPGPDRRAQPPPARRAGQRAVQPRDGRARRDSSAGLGDRMGVVLVEHHMDLVMSVCDRLVVLDFGQVIAEGTPDVVRAEPDVTTAYLGEEASGHRWRRRRPGPAPCLRSSDLSVSYGAVEALRSVTFSGRAGAITAVLGANGAGKTTLLRTISGLVRPTTGSVALRGRGPHWARRWRTSPASAWPTSPRGAGSSRS